MKKLLVLGVAIFLFLEGAAHAQSVLITWDDNSDDEEGFLVERTMSDGCLMGWEVIAYTGRNQNFLLDVFISGACYRVASYNEFGTSTPSNIIQMPIDF